MATEPGPNEETNVRFSSTYPVDLVIPCPEKSNRIRVLFRLFLIVPIYLLHLLLANPETLFQRIQSGDFLDRKADQTTTVLNITRRLPDSPPIILFYPFLVIGYLSTAGSFVQLWGYAVFPTALMLLFRRKYPDWWFDWNKRLTQFSLRIAAYALLLRDEYPSTTEEQALRVRLDYPDARRDLNRWMPLVKWLLALPHMIVLAFLCFGLIFTTIFAWFAILAVGRIPRPLFNYGVGVLRYTLRVNAYATLLVTDRYPPFYLDQE